MFQEALKVKAAEVKRREADSRRKERLAFVTMSLSNIVPERPRKARGDREKAAKFNKAAAGGRCVGVAYQMLGAVYVVGKQRGEGD